MQVFLTPQAQKDLQKIPQKNRLKIKRRTQLLIKSPFAGKKLKGKLKGYWSLKVWPYRIIYEIYKNKVWVDHIVHRQKAY